MSSNKKGPRSNFAGRSNATSNGKVSSSSSSTTAASTPSTATNASTASSSTTTSTTTNAWTRPLQQQQQKPSRPPPGLGGPTPNEQKVMEHINNNNNNNSHTTNHSNSNLHIALRDRFIHLTVSMVGQKVVVTQTNGAVLEGLFGTFTPFSSQPAATKNIYVLKACRLIQPPTDTTVQQPLIKDGETVMIPADKVSQVLVKSMRLDATGSNGTTHHGATAVAGGATTTKGGDMFQTDTEISAAKSAARAGDLIAAGSAWTSPAANSRADALLGGLEDNKVGSGTRSVTAAANNLGNINANNTASGSTTAGAVTAGGLRGNIGAWDQFKANEELFNVSANFDENLYTTELDRSRIDARTEAEADRIAREILQQPTKNSHVAEERGQAVQTDYDEEDRYSGVLPSAKETAGAVAGAARSGASRKEKAVPAALPVTNSRASALKGGLDGPKKTAPPPVKKMNYAAAVAAQADKKAAAASASIVTPAAPVTTPTPLSSEVTLEDNKPLEEEPTSAAPVETAREDAPVETTTTTTSEQPPTEQQLADEVAKLLVDDGVEEEKAAVEAPAEESTQQSNEVTPAVEQPKQQQQPMDDVSEAKTEASENAKKIASKLNPTAKEFTFNPAAKMFTPSFVAPATIPAAAVVATPDAAAAAHFVDPNTGMPMGHAMPHMHGVHYMPQGHMGQHGMMPMMNPQFLRFQPPYPTMDPMLAQQQHQQMQPPQPMPGDQHNAQPAAASGSPEEEALNQQQQQQRDVAAQQQQPGPHMAQIPQQQQQGQQPQQMQNQQMAMQYHVPPPGGVGYFTQGMPMPPRGPGGVPQMAGYHPQFMPPQQMHMVPNAGPYRQMYPMQPGMPPNMQMRAPYYPTPGAPMHYPQNAYMGGGRMMEEGDYRGGRGARGNATRGRRGGRRGGVTGGRSTTGGRAYYPPGGGGSGRQTPQTPTEMDGVPTDMQDDTGIENMIGSADDHQREPAD